MASEKTVEQLAEKATKAAQANNAAVSYNPYNEYDYKAAYAEAAAKRQTESDAAYGRLQAETNRAEQDAAAAYSNMNTRARQLAADTMPTPTTETEAIMDRAGVGNEINKNNAQGTTRAQNRALLLKQTGYDRDAANANWRAQAAIEEAGLSAQENRTKQEFDRDAWQYAQNRAFENAQMAAQQAQYEAEEAYQKAMNELATYGKVMTKKSAAALGVKVGTTSFEYNQWQDSIKPSTGGGRSGGRRGGSGGGSGGYAEGYTDTGTATGYTDFTRNDRDKIGTHADALLAKRAEEKARQAIGTGYGQLRR